jgi:hypothetical protein
MAFSGSGAASGASIGSAVGPWGTAIGAILGGFFGGGKKKTPVIPQKEIDLNEEQQKSIQGNLAAQSDIEKLLARGNEFNQDQAISLLEKAMPGYGKLSSKLTSTADELLTNPYDVPSDVQSNLARIAAERGVSRGTKGQFNDFSLLRDLGVNSLEYGQGRINQAQSITSLLGSLAPRVNPMSPISFYTTPAQQAQATQTNNANRQAILQGGANAATEIDNQNQAATWSNLNSIIANNAEGLKMVGGKVKKAAGF